MTRNSSSTPRAPMRTIIILICVALLVSAGCGGGAKHEVTKDAAIAAAEGAYAKARAEGVDMARGPCIADDLLPDWVADVAHDPRQPVDDKPQNQCSRYRAGKAHHFVELDPDGKLIRAE